MVARRNHARRLSARRRDLRRLHDEAGRIRAEARPRECVFAVVVTRWEAARRRARGRGRTVTTTAPRSRSSMLTGADARTLDLGPAEDFQIVAVPEWSPDGKLIAFVDVGKGTIGLVSPDGKAAPLPQVAADAKRALVVTGFHEARVRPLRRDEGGRALGRVVLDLATGREAVFAGEQHGAQSPTWSPEGDQIAFISMSERATSTTHDLALVRRRGLRCRSSG